MLYHKLGRYHARFEFLFIEILYFIEI